MLGCLWPPPSPVGLSRSPLTWIRRQPGKQVRETVWLSVDACVGAFVRRRFVHPSFVTITVRNKSNQANARQSAKFNFDAFFSSAVSFFSSAFFFHHHSATRASPAHGLPEVFGFPHQAAMGPGFFIELARRVSPRIQVQGPLTLHSFRETLLSQPFRTRNTSAFDVKFL